MPTLIRVTITDDQGVVLESITLEGPEGSIPFAARVADHITNRFEEHHEEE